MIGIGGTGCDGKARDSGDACERLATKTERMDPQQITLTRELACGMPEDAQGKVIERHPFAVIPDEDLTLATVLDVDDDTLTFCVDCVLDQFLDNRCGALDHLSGGDLRGELLIQSVDSHLPPRASFPRATGAPRRRASAAHALPAAGPDGRRIGHRPFVRYLTLVKGDRPCKH